MKDLLLTLLHWAVMTATLCGPGGVRAVIAENLLLKQQLIVLRRPRRRAPRLTASDRLLFGFGSLFLSPGRIRKVAIGVRPSTFLAFHQGLVRRKYRRLFSSSECPRLPRRRRTRPRRRSRRSPPVGATATPECSGTSSGSWSRRRSSAHQRSEILLPTGSPLPRSNHSHH